MPAMGNAEETTSLSRICDRAYIEDALMNLCIAAERSVADSALTIIAG